MLHILIRENAVTVLPGLLSISIRVIKHTRMSLRYLAYQLGYKDERDQAKRSVRSLLKEMEE
jgi:hypothetical protein